jgi:hypothetical protein
MPPALMPACCRRSQIADTSATLGDSMRPSEFNFRPTTWPGRTTCFHGWTGFCALK